MSRERRLGRGLEALLGRAWDEPEATPATDRVAIETPLDGRMSRDEHGQLWLNCDAIERQSLSAAADVRRGRDRRSGGQHPHARHPAAARGAARRRRVSN